MPVYRILVETDERDVPVDGGGHWRPIRQSDLAGVAPKRQPVSDWADLHDAITGANDTALAFPWHLVVVDRDTRDILWDTRTDAVGRSD